MLNLPVILTLCSVASTPQTVLLDFYSDTCGPCRAMEPVVAKLIADGYPVRKVNVSRKAELAQRYRVTAVPCFVALVNGQEIGRLTGATSPDQLAGMLQRAGIAPSTNRTAIRRTQALANESALVALPSARRNARALRETRATSEDLRRGNPGIVGRATANAAIQSAQQTSFASSGASFARLVASTVRLRVEDPQGHSFGTGTIIDARDGQALVLTCGHIFRDSQGQGSISVDLFASGGPTPSQTVAGQLLRYDLERDVALVIVRTDGALPAARLVSVDHQPRPRERVVVVGCDLGEPPRAQQTTVSAVNKYLGPDNIVVAGEPKEGRSGGGLFTLDGRLLGVCNAADPLENEGIYAGIRNAWEVLEEAQVAHLLRASQPESSLPITNAEAHEASPIAAHVPQGNLSEPPLTPTTHIEPRLDESSSPSSSHGGVEIVCVTRPLDGTSRKSDVVVLDRPSQEFLRLLELETDRQNARRLTSLEVRSHAPAKARGIAGIPRSAQGWRTQRRR